MGEIFTKTAKITVAALLLLLAVLAGGCSRVDTSNNTAKTELAKPTEQTEATETLEEGTTELLHVWETGYVATLHTDAIYLNDEGVPLGTFLRGTQVEYEATPDGRSAIRLGDARVYLQEGASVVADAADAIPAHIQYVQTTVNLRDVQGKLLAAFAEKGTAVQVTGCDYLLENGQVHMYRVSYAGTEGYIMPWYLAQNEADAAVNYDDGNYATHAAREDRYGGGGAGDLDYYPRMKGEITGNEMPEECRALYLVNWKLNQVDEYLAIAENSEINTFVVDILDGGAVGYAADVMKKYCPSGAEAANNTVDKYREVIQKLKDAGYYVIGRITTFNDTYLVKDHPEYAISDLDGKPLQLSGEYWPTPFNRTVWQYKVDLAVEAVEMMGFHEIQFDYVRFPDSTGRYEEAGTIDFHNTYGETKAQAIQRFLMYAADILHEHGVYVSADVYGESAYNYVTAYGQYWPAISNVVDAISGMPYPDHFAASGEWLPWEHPYDTLYSWGQSAMQRQSETATPAAVRTWIQAYNAIRKPYNTYGPEEISAQISALRDAGCSGGYMTWHGSASLEKYTMLMPAFAPSEGT